MAKVSGTASIGARVGVGHKKGFHSHDSVNPFFSMSFDREVSNDLSDEELADKAEEIISICRKRVETKMRTDIEDLQRTDN